MKPPYPRITARSTRSSVSCSKSPVCFAATSSRCAAGAARSPVAATAIPRLAIARCISGSASTASTDGLHTGRVGSPGQGVGRALLGGPPATRADFARVSRADREAEEVALLRRFAAYVERRLGLLARGWASRCSALAPDPDSCHLALGLRDARAAPAQLQRPRAGASPVGRRWECVGRGSQAERRHHRSRVREPVGTRRLARFSRQSCTTRGAARPFTRGLASRIGWWRWMATEIGTSRARCCPECLVREMKKEPPETGSSTTTASWSRSGWRHAPPPSWTSNSSVPGREESPRHDGSSSASCASTPG